MVNSPDPNNTQSQNKQTQDERVWKEFDRNEFINTDKTRKKSPRPPRERRRKGWRVSISCSGMLLLLLLNVLLLTIVNWPLLQARLRPTQGPTLTDLVSLPTKDTSTTPNPTESATPTVSPLPPTLPMGDIQPPSTISIKNGLIVLALQEGNDTHLFAYQPEQLPYTRLTSGPWDDITPAISPDGQMVAFASNRNGYWDLYLLRLTTGEVNQLTDTPEYDAAPSWSPDSVWLVYESYQNNNLDLLITPIDGSLSPSTLSDNLATEHSPSWSPKGREIAFISNRSGENEIWIADLNQTDPEQRFRNFSRDTRSKEIHPTWSPDGNLLAWASILEGHHNLLISELDAQSHPYILGSGDWPVFSADGETLLSILLAPNQAYLTAYPVERPGLTLPVIQIPGTVQGITWANAAFPLPLPDAYRQAIAITPTALYETIVTPSGDSPGDRAFLVNLPTEVAAPYPLLHDRVDESFNALRQQLGHTIGWDYLDTLQNAYVPLTSSLEPGMQHDWLYTGRAFATNSLPLNAGWLQVVREDFGAETYWRIYARTRFQEGSSGIPMHDLPWNFDPRYSGDPEAFQAGGRQAPAIPAGYWIDLTNYVRAYHWKRLPAVLTWQNALPLTRYNVFALTEELDWYTAMLELYPPEALVTPTVLIPPTRTPTRTRRWYFTDTPTLTNTLRPTNTPIPPTETPTEKLESTRRATRTQTPSKTKTPTP